HLPPASATPAASARRPTQHNIPPDADQPSPSPRFQDQPPPPTAAHETPTSVLPTLPVYTSPPCSAPTQSAYDWLPTPRAPITRPRSYPNPQRTTPNRLAARPLAPSPHVAGHQPHSPPAYQPARLPNSTTRAPHNRPRSN